MYPVLLNVKKIRRQPYISYIYINNKNKILKQPVNETAVSILELCNGENSIPEIIKKMSVKYSEDIGKAKQLVNEFIEYSRKVGVINLQKESYPMKDYVEFIGGNDYWLPELVILELTYFCPLKCKHCYLNDVKPIDMNFKILSKICQELKDIGVDGVQLTGGEPLIYPEINEIINFFCDSGIKVVITTSGFLSKSELSNLLPSLKRISETNGYIQISIDGLEKNHNNRRGNSKSFKNAINFIDEIVKENVDVHVATTVTEESFSDLEELSRILKGKCVKVHRIGCVSERGRAIKNKLKVNVDFIKKLIRKIGYLKRILEDSNFYILELEEFKINQAGVNLINCGAGYRFFSISPDFKLYPCLMIDVPFGDAKNKSFIDYQNLYKKYSQINSPNRDICENCDLLLKCERCISEGLFNKNKVEYCRWYAKNKYFLKEIL